MCVVRDSTSVLVSCPSGWCNEVQHNPSSWTSELLRKVNDYPDNLGFCSAAGHWGSQLLGKQNEKLAKQTPSLSGQRW